MCDETKWSDLADGNSGHMHEDNPGHYSLSTTSYPLANGVYFRALSSQTGFNDGRSDASGPVNLAVTAPPHGGLSSTGFTVNESTSPQSNVADTVLRFAAVQTSRAAGLKVRVQATNPDGSWSDLPGGGGMTFDATSNRYILDTRNYPLRNGVSFRAIASASAYSDSISTPVGPFDLTALKPHLGPMKLYVTGDGYKADWDFQAIVSDRPTGFKVRIQSTTTPAKEESWTDLSVGSPFMNHSTDPNFPNFFELLANKLPDACGIYFRAVASADGYVDGISNAVGSFDVKTDNPPEVAIVAPSGSGDPHDQNNPRIVEAGNVGFLVKVLSSNKVNFLRILSDYNQQTIVQYNTPTADGVARYSASFNLSIGDHIIEAVAVDEVTGCNGQVLHGLARNGTGPVYVRVVPQGTASAMAQFKTTGKAPAAAVSGPRVFHAVKDGYWADPQTWSNEFNISGPPVDGDFAIIEHHTIHFNDTRGGFARSVFINDGTLVSDPGTESLLDVSSTLTITSCSVIGGVGIFVEAGAVGNLNSPMNLTFQPDQSTAITRRGEFLIDGTLNIHGAAGTLGSDKITLTRHNGRFGTVNWLPPLQLTCASTDPTCGTRVLSTKQLELAGQIRGTLSQLLTSDGAGLITSDGAGLIGHDGGSLIGHDGGSVISQGGGNIIAAGGGNVISQGGGNVISQGGGNIIAAGGGNVISQGGGNVISQGGGNFKVGNPAAGEKVFSSGPAASGSTPSSFYVQTDGITDLSSFSIVGSVSLDGGTLSGSGAIIGDLYNDGGSISPGHSPGVLGVTGNFTQTYHGRLVVENGGSSPAQFDQFQVGGSAKLGGILEVRLTDGYLPEAQDTFSPFAYNGASGNFDNITADTTVTVTPTGLLAKVDPSIPIAMIKLANDSISVNKDAGHATVTINRTGDTNAAVTLTYATQDGTATQQNDYTPMFGSVTLNPGETSKDVTIPLINNGYGSSSAGASRNFQLVIDNPVGGQIQLPNVATINITNNNAADLSVNPLDNSDYRFFIREQYLDFLGREPEPNGMQGWLNVLNNCGTTMQQPCDRIEVSSDFFRSDEFQSRGYFVYRFYETLGRFPHYDEFVRDSARVNGFLTPAQLEASKVALVADFMSRFEFRDRYDSITDPTGYVDALLQSVGLPNHPARSSWINGLSDGSMTRARVLRNLIDSPELQLKYYNEAFVVMEYFGYLRRDPDILYLNWIQTMNQNPGNYRLMINGFFNSIEYRQRFGKP